MTNRLHVHARVGAQQAHGQLILGHLQRKDGGRLARHHRRMANQVHAEARLAHRRARADDDQLAAVQTGQQVVQIDKARGHAVDAALERGELLDAQIGIGQHVRDVRERGALVPAHDDIEDGLFRHAQNVADGIRLGIAGRGDVARSLDHAPERRLFIDNLHIRARVDRRGHALGQLHQVAGAAHALERAPAGQLVVHRHQIDGHALGVQLVHRVEDLAMRRLIEVLRRQQLEGHAKRFAILHHAAEHASLRVRIVGRHAHDVLLHGAVLLSGACMIRPWRPRPARSSPP